MSNTLKMSSQAMLSPKRRSDICERHGSDESSIATFGPESESSTSTRDIISFKENCFLVPDLMACSLSSKLSMSPTPLLAIVLLLWLTSKNCKLRKAKSRISCVSKICSFSSFENISSNSSQTAAVKTCAFTVHRLLTIYVSGLSGSERKSIRQRRMSGRQEIWTKYFRVRSNAMSNQS